MTTVEAVILIFLFLEMTVFLFGLIYFSGRNMGDDLW